MKTDGVTRVSFSANKLSITLPTGWQELTDKELHTVYSCMTNLTADALPLAVFRLLTGIRIVKELQDGDFVCYMRCDGEEVIFTMSASQMLGVYDELEWIFTPGAVPVRLAQLRGHSAVNAEFHGIKFGDYLAVENNYQGYLHAKSESALRRVAAVLYPGLGATPLSDLEMFNMIQWLVQVKNLFSGVFTNLFKPASEGADVSALEIMNNEIRALTGGDITKEGTVLNTDCWRALTELDFKAKEAEDFKALIPKK